MARGLRRVVCVLAVVVVCLAAGLGPAHAAAPAATITVSGEQWGVTTRYIGATEGGDGFSLADLADLGINTYRLWAGMSRWEPVDDDGAYGSPTIAQIKADPDIIPWSVWDQAMDAVGWGGVSTRTLLASLKDAGILPVVTVRNRDNDHLPLWAPDPPRTQEDWNEWWEFVFATVYWINVRNDYRVDDWQVHNEPDLLDQGWSGTEAEYYEFVRVTADAIDYVYATYLDNRPHRIYGPVTTSAYEWYSTFAHVGDCLDVWDFHIYGFWLDFGLQPAFAHGKLGSIGQEEKPIWVSEWGTCCEGRYRDPIFANVVAHCLIQASRPGDDYVYGSHIFSMYSWGGGLWEFGIIASDGPTLSYYAMRLAVRALQGARPTYESTCNDANLLAITTQDTADGYPGPIYLLVNSYSDAAVPVEADLSKLVMSGLASLRQFDATHRDVPMGLLHLTDGCVSFTVPARGTVCLKVPPAIFRDVPEDHWAYAEIMACAGADIVQGYPDRLYRPGKAVTRGQMAVFIARGLAGGDEYIPTGPAEATFPDVPTDHWAYDYVEYAAAHDIVEGYGDGSYRPAWAVTRGQMSVFVARAMVDPPGDEGLADYTPPATATFPDVPVGFWCFNHVEYLHAQDVVGGYPDGAYRPTATVTRDQMAVYVARGFGP